MRLIISYTAAIGANVHKNFLPALRVIIALTALVYTGVLIAQLPAQSLQQWKNVYNLSPSVIIFAIGVLVLMIFNWALESAKWKLLSAKVQHLSWPQAFLSVLYGISLGMITPKRTGEFAGRLLFLQPWNRLSGILLNSAGSLCQLTITLLAGALAIWLQLPHFSAQYGHLVYLPGSISMRWLHLVWVFAIVVLVVVLALPRLKNHRIFTQSSLLHRIKASPVGQLKFKDIAITLLLSLGRYLIFTMQFYLLLKIFGLRISLPVAFQLIAITWLVMAVIPLSAIWEVGVRGPVAVLVFGSWFAHTNQPFGEMTVIAASTTLWLVNLALPALAGGLLSLTTDYKTSFSGDG